jgi:hypothetical protein
MPICTNLMKFKCKCIKRSRFEKLFSPNFLEFTLGFFYIFSRIFSNFELKNHRFLITNRTDPAEFQRILANSAEFVNPGVNK